MSMNAVDIYLKEDRGLHHVNELVQIGIPLERGAIFDANDVTLADNGHPVAFQGSPTAHWPDGSIRWLTVAFLANLEPNQDLTLTLRPNIGGQQPPEFSPAYADTGDRLRLELGSGAIELQHGALAWQAQNSDGMPLARYRAELAAGPYDASLAVRNADRWRVLEQGPIFSRAQSEGDWLDDQGNRLARYRCTLTYFNEGNSLAVDFCIHNPARARHPGGLWDLGDPGSIHFRSFELVAEFSGMHTAWVKEHPEDAPYSTVDNTPLKLYQDSSGGLNWRSRNHIDADGNVTTRFRGYRLFSGQTRIRDGLRAEPVIGLKGAATGAQASIRQFWQNFPSAMSTNGGELRVALFPADAATPYELQGGERKTQTAYFHLGGDERSLDWTQHPIVPVIPAAQYERAQAFPWFNANAQPGPLEALIRQGVEGSNNFFEKREVIDEYGWRNFGDIFADHETLYQQPDEAPYISHYNNQYDAIYGFARQFALTGDRRWFELMDDLANHVRDIDIYHTDEDRSEYNHGLFWHTDHYLDAKTATHRTFTQKNDTSSTPGQTGGGPGAEHCYTSGLLYHHWITGHQASADAVLELAGWIRESMEGQRGLLEQILRFKKQDLPCIKAKLQGKALPEHTYPFTRATGNYLNTLLDAWLLTNDHNWLRLAENVIRQTLHPNDDISQRNLLDVETGWSYLVLMNSLARYLLIKEHQGHRDDPYVYARHAFNRYTRWILANERPFLADTSSLEFPNHTWTAQDVRKAMLLYIAVWTDAEKSATYRDKAEESLTCSLENLKSNREASFARILAILMQNHGPHLLFENPGLVSPIPPLPKKIGDRSPNLTWSKLATRMFRRMVTGLITFRPRREKAWLTARVSR